jgi:plasmid stabilization system protein ParE
MDYKVDFATQTGRDLYSITQFLADKNPAVAHRLGDALIDAALSLGFLPRRGGRVIGRPGVLKLVYLPHHIIFYRIDEAKRIVEILRFWDGRKNPAELKL